VQTYADDRVLARLFGRDRAVKDVPYGAISREAATSSAAEEVVITTAKVAKGRSGHESSGGSGSQSSGRGNVAKEDVGSLWSTDGDNGSLVVSKGKRQRTEKIKSNTSRSSYQHTATSSTTHGEWSKKEVRNGYQLN
jgi:hypothetical protein